MTLYSISVFNLEVVYPRKPSNTKMKSSLEHPYCIETTRNQQQCSSQATVTFQNRNTRGLQYFLFSACGCVCQVLFSVPISLVHLCPDAAHVQVEQEGCGMADKQLNSTALCKDTSGIQRGQGQAGRQCQGTTGMEGMGTKEGNAQLARCTQSQNQEHEAEPQQSNRMTPSAP